MNIWAADKSSIKLANSHARMTKPKPIKRKRKDINEQPPTVCVSFFPLFSSFCLCLCHAQCLCGRWWGQSVGSVNKHFLYGRLSKFIHQKSGSSHFFSTNVQGKSYKYILPSCAYCRHNPFHHFIVIISMQVYQFLPDYVCRITVIEFISFQQFVFTSFHRLMFIQ